MEYPKFITKITKQVTYSGNALYKCIVKTKDWGEGLKIRELFELNGYTIHTICSTNAGYPAFTYYRPKYDFVCGALKEKKMLITINDLQLD